MSFAAAQKPASQAERLLEADAGTVFVIRDTVDMDDFKAQLWLAVLVHKSKVRAFEQKLGHESVAISDYGKVLLRSGEPITADMITPLLH